MEAVLVINDLALSYGVNSVLNGVHLNLIRGERHALIGPNGAGKTTLINILSGNLKPQRGDVLFHGESVLPLPPYAIARRGIARAAQIPQGFPTLRVWDHLAAALQHGYGWWSNRENLERDIRIQAEQAFLDDVLEQTAEALAHGARKRLELATALALSPAVLLLDEPTAGLSASETDAMVALLKSVSATLLIVEHDMDVVAALADRVSVLFDGNVLAQGTPEEIAADEQVQAIYLQGHVAR